MIHDSVLGIRVAFVLEPVGKFDQGLGRVVGLKFEVRIILD